VRVSDNERITAFDHRFARAQATDVVDLPWGFAVLHEEFPLSQYHNRIAVTSAVPAADVLAAAEVVLGGAGLIRDALRRGRQAGSELSFLTADLDDWPHQWYQRIGYVDAGRTHHFSRRL
jgi:hypothetical protein